MVIAGTGHRPNKLGGYSDVAYKRLVKLAENYLRSNTEVTEVISGMALGWDQALAEAAILIGVRLTAAIPCYNQDKMWPEASKKKYRLLLGMARSVIFVTESEYTGECMQKRNVWMVDNCDTILTIHDGTSGGTYNCLQYAKSKNKHIVNLYEQYKVLTVSL